LYFLKKKKDGKINWDELNMQNTKINKEFISKFYSEKNFKPFVAYAQSKLANVLFSMELARRYKGNFKNTHYLIKFYLILKLKYKKMME
jgi:hypothetical protein